MKTIRYGVLLAGLLYCVFPTFGQTAFEKDCAAFDRGYIPALVATKSGNMIASQNAITNLNRFWKVFKQNYAGSYDADTQWPADFNQVEAKLLAATQIVQNGGPLTRAHDELESIRTTLMELRLRNGIVYYLDYLTRYHEPMEAIVRMASEKTPETLSDSDVERMSDAAARARQLWIEVKSAKFDAVLFGFEEGKVNALQHRIEEEDKALAALRTALRSDDRSMVIEKAKALQPPFAELYKLFGDFSSFK